MRVLFDQGTPVPLRDHLSQHTVDTAFERGWSELVNGELLDTAEREGYHLLITTDRNLKFQQNLANRQLAIVVLLSTSWPRMQLRIEDIRTAVDGQDRAITSRWSSDLVATLCGSVLRRELPCGPVVGLACPDTRPPLS